MNTQIFVDKINKLTNLFSFQHKFSFFFSTRILVEAEASLHMGVFLIQMSVKMEFHKEKYYQVVGMNFLSNIS